MICGKGRVMNRVLALLLLSVGLYSCGGIPTPYQPSGLIGGYQEKQVSENSFKVYFFGNGYTRGERASDFVLLRSAEVADQHGFPYFAVAEVETPSPASRINTILCFKEKPQRPGVVYDAKSVQQSLRQKYDIQSSAADGKDAPKWLALKSADGRGAPSL
jgi:hypothetical protein